MSPGSTALDLTYAAYMKNHPYGTALYTPLPVGTFHPGSCGYFGENGFWNPVADLADPALLASQGYGPVREKLQRAPREDNVEWGPKASEDVKSRKIELTAGISSTLAAAIPVNLAVGYNYSTSTSGGAILLTTPPVAHERFYYESPFKTWIRENAETLIKTRNEVLEFGLWIVTSTWSTSECAINVWNESSKGVDVGFKTSVVPVGELGPSGGWWTDVQKGGWVKHRATDEANGLVVFFGGLRFKYRRIPLRDRLKSYKPIATYRAGGQREGIETLGDVALSGGNDGEEDVVFAIDCEYMLESDLEYTTTKEDEEEEW